MNKTQARLQTVLLGISIAIAFLIPGTVGSAVGGWVAALLLVHIIRRSPSPFRCTYLAFSTAHLFGFYWLVTTISVFGNFPYWAAVLIYILFIFTNSLYSLLIPFLVRYSHPLLRKWHLDIPIGVAVAEFLAVRIFPWHFGHTQIAFTPLVQIADIAGVTFVTFVLMWLATVAEEIITTRRINSSIIAPAIVFLLAIFYGNAAISEFSTFKGPGHKIAVVQGNIPIEDKHSGMLFKQNIQSYMDLGSAYESKDILMIWPETVVMSALPTSMIGNSTLSFLSADPKWLIGSVTTDLGQNYYNSAIAVSSGAQPFDLYHKLILMPFGEYVPFSKSFPWLLDLAHMEGELTPGDRIKVFKYAETEKTPELNVAPLICYEDVVASIAREASNNGANLLVNITNDAWFGDTIAPYQHNLLASFRAIENRRFLVRAANSGLSSIIDPLGKTTSQLSTYSQGVLEKEIYPISQKSLYSAYVGDLPWAILSVVSALLSLVSVIKKK